MVISKIKIRTLMVAIAVIAIMFGLLVLRNRRNEFLERVSRYTEYEEIHSSQARRCLYGIEYYRLEAKKYRMLGDRIPNASEIISQSEAAVRRNEEAYKIEINRIQYYKTIRIKYEYLSNHAWISAGSDDPEPE